MAPDPDDRQDRNRYSRDWRNRVRELHDSRIVGLKVGQTVCLKEGCKPARLKLVSVKPLKGVVENGMVFKIPRKMIASIVEQATKKEAGSVQLI